MDRLLTDCPECPSCPDCRTPMAHTRTSADGDATEFRCGTCPWVHVLKKSAPGEVFLFFPDDIQTAFAGGAAMGVEPLFPAGVP